jgi:hypothetical protein
MPDLELKKGNFIRYKNGPTGQGGYGVVLDDGEVFTIVVNGGMFGYSLSKRKLKLLGKPSLLLNSEVDRLTPDVRLALNAAMVATR